MRAAAKQGSRAGRPKVSEIEERTDALLAVAETLLVKHGYERATLNLIAKEAGVSKQTIYVKYGGKPGLLRAVLQRISENSASDTIAAEDDLTLFEGLFERTRRLILIHRTEVAVAIMTICLREAQKFPEFRDEMIRARQENLVAPLVRYLEHMKRRGLVKDIECETVAWMLIWSVSEEVVDTASSGIRKLATAEEIDRQAAFIAGFFRDAIQI